MSVKARLAKLTAKDGGALSMIFIEPSETRERAVLRFMTKNSLQSRPERMIYVSWQAFKK